MILVSIIFELIIELIVKGGGFIIGILALYFMWKSRTSSYREILYSKQLEGYLNLAEFMHKIISHIYLINMSKNDEISINEDKLKNLKDDLERLKWGEWLDSIFKWSNILPEELNKAFIEFGDHIIIHEDLSIDDVFKARDKIHNKAKDYFSIIPLSEETKKLLETLKAKLSKK